MWVLILGFPKIGVPLLEVLKGFLLYIGIKIGHPILGNTHSWGIHRVTIVHSGFNLLSGTCSPTWHRGSGAFLGLVSKPSVHRDQDRSFRRAKSKGRCRL